MPFSQIRRLGPCRPRRCTRIEAHLTIVFAALAISREAQHRTGASIKKVLNTLRPLRAAVITSAGSTTTAAPAIPQEAAELLELLTPSGH